MKSKKRNVGLVSLISWMLVFIFVLSSCFGSKKSPDSRHPNSQETENPNLAENDEPPENPSGKFPEGSDTPGIPDNKGESGDTPSQNGTENSGDSGGTGENAVTPDPDPNSSKTPKPPNGKGQGGGSSSQGGSGNSGSTGNTGGSNSSGNTGNTGGAGNSNGGTGNTGGTGNSNDSGGNNVIPGFKRKDKDVAEAKLMPVNGINRLFVDGEQVNPIIFAGDNFTGLGDIKTTVAGRQTIKAINNGSVELIRVYVDIYSTNPRGIAQALNESIRNLNSIDENAYVLIYYRSWEPDVSIFGGKESYDAFIDQKGNPVGMGSMASDLYLEHSKKLMRNLIDAVMANPAVSNRVIGYFPSGNGVEWFLPADGRYDCSGAAQDKFRAFLKNKYKTDAALRTAWGDNGVSLSTVTIPKDVQGGRGTTSSHKTTLYLKASDQKYIDFYDYYNDILSDYILELSAVVKQKTSNRSLVGYYYGYNFESYTSTPLSGIFDMEKILSSPNVDFLAGPVSYADRNAGGTGMSMSLLSSVTANGKLWIDESDYRSPNSTAPGNENLGVGMEGGIDTMAEMIEISKRQMGKQMIYNSGTWWLDLIGKGWWDHTGFWNTQKQLIDLYSSYSALKKNQTPEVVLVYDSRAVSLLADAWQTSIYIYQNIRDEISKTGLSFGLYSQQDVINGRAKGAKLYIMMTPWRINSADVPKLKSVLHQKGTTTLWLYGNGQTSTADFAGLSGMTLSVDNVSRKRALNMTLNSAGKSKFIGMPNTLQNPSAYQMYYVSGGGAQTLATYSLGGKVSMAAVEKDGWKSIFYGGFSLPPAMISSIAKYAGANIYSDGRDVTYIDDNLLVLHATSSGTKSLKFPSRCDVYDYFNNKWYTNVSELSFRVDKGTTHYYFYGSRSVLQNHGIGK